MTAEIKAIQDVAETGPQGGDRMNTKNTPEDRKAEVAKTMRIIHVAAGGLLLEDYEVIEAALVKLSQPVHAPELTALKEIECQLRTVIAQMPADNRGTIESGIKTGLSIALLFVLYAITENGGAA